MTAVRSDEISVEVIETVEQLEALPSFTKDIDPSKVSLDSIIAVYNFKEKVECQKINCHKSHNHGYVVRLDDGRTTNVGNICGAQLDPDKFHLQKVMANRYIERQKVISTLAEKKLSLCAPGKLNKTFIIAKEITDLIRFFENEFGVKLVNILRNMARRKDFEVYEYRLLTENQIEIRKSTRNGSFNDEEHERYKLGSLVHCDFFYEDVRKMVYDVIEPAYKELSNNLIEELATPALKKLSRQVHDAEVLIDKISKISVQSKNFSETRENFELIKYLTHELQGEDATKASAGIYRYMIEKKWM